MKPMNVLVVEDEITIAEALRQTLCKYFDCEVVDTACDGAQAWDKLSATNYDIVVSDWNMPVKTGKELLSEMRRHDQTKATPFLMLTARADRESVHEAVKAGTNAYLIKPFEREKLITCIERLLDINRKPDTTNGADDLQSEPDTIDIIDKVSKQIKAGQIKLPVLSDTAIKINDLFNREEVEIDEVVTTLRQDAGIVPKLIGIANSPMYPSTKRITDLEDAVIRIGLKQTKAIALLSVNQGLYSSEDRRFEAILKTLWLHGSAVAYCNKRIAEELSLDEPNLLFTAGILHDIGKLVLINLIMEEYPTLDETEAKKIIDALHTQAGAAVLKAWELPRLIVEAAYLHHDVRPDDEFSLPLRILKFSNTFARRLGHSLTPPDDTDMHHLSTALGLGLNANQLDEIELALTIELEQLQTTH